MKTIILLIMLNTLLNNDAYDGILYIQNNYVPYSIAATTEDAQRITDDPDLAACYSYGNYEQTVICDHCNQAFKCLSNTKKGDIIYVIDRDMSRKYKCVKIKTLSVNKNGHIYEKKNQYMGDCYKGKAILLVTCKGNKRLVTYWKEV